MKRTRRKGGKRKRTRKRRTPRRKQKGGTHTPPSKLSNFWFKFNGNSINPQNSIPSPPPLRYSDLDIIVPSEPGNTSPIATPPPKSKNNKNPGAPVKSNIRKEFNDFPLDIVIQNADQLFTNSKNGNLVKLKVQNKYYLLKTPQAIKQYFNADNLMYEYVIGLFLNKYVEQFPSIVRTLTLLDIVEGKVINNDALDITAETCEKVNDFALITDFFDDSQTLEQLLEDDVKDDITFADLAKIYYQIYGPLAALDGHFSHNDLHLNNIMVKTLSTPVTFIYKSNEKTVTFTTQYLAKMIDYGRGRIDGIYLKDFFYPGGIPETANLRICGLYHVLYDRPDEKGLAMDNLEDILGFLETEIGKEGKENTGSENTVTIDITPIDNITSKITPMTFSDTFDKDIKPFFLYEDESVNKGLFSNELDRVSVKRQRSPDANNYHDHRS